MWTFSSPGLAGRTSRTSRSSSIICAVSWRSVSVDIRPASPVAVRSEIGLRMRKCRRCFRRYMPTAGAAGNLRNGSGTPCTLFRHHARVRRRNQCEDKTFSRRIRARHEPLTGKNEGNIVHGTAHLKTARSAPLVAAALHSLDIRCLLPFRSLDGVKVNPLSFF